MNNVIELNRDNLVETFDKPTTDWRDKRDGDVAPAAFRDVMGRFATGVTILTVSTPEQTMHAMTANAFMSVSLEPPLVAVSIATKARMSSYLDKNVRLGIHVLSADQDVLCRHFGGRPRDDLDVPVDWLDGVPLLPGCAVRMVTTVEDLHPAGDHHILIARLTDMECWERSPLLFHRGNLTSFPVS